MLRGVLCWICISIFLIPSVYAAEFSGNTAIQWRGFINEPLNPLQHNNYVSISAEPEVYFEWDNNQTFTFTPFYRVDQYDDERTHGDIRELSWKRVFEDWELTVGLDKVYWGVTETLHLVDIINQTDQLEGVDGEDKLGQPMIGFSTEQDWGLVDFYILPGFRERKFASLEGRPRFEAEINTNAATYESTDEEHHIDYALRYFTFIDNMEIGISYFNGTGREPVTYLPVPGQPGVIAPFYALIQQTGLDFQALVEDWTWKIEVISRSQLNDHFNAMTSGFEYTFVGILDSDTDLGVIIEHLFDSRDALATTPFQNDMTTGFRLVLNDEQSSEILLGITVDLDDHEISTFIEGTKRIGDSLKLEIELRTFTNTNPNGLGLLYNFRDDDFLQVDLAWYF